MEPLPFPYRRESRFYLRDRRPESKDTKPSGGVNVQVEMFLPAFWAPQPAYEDLWVILGFKSVLYLLVGNRYFILLSRVPQLAGL